jgi:spore coat polysaccharide biosynthesis predicted glycosyltransferase SpsG
VVVVDLPDVAAATDLVPADRLVVFDDRNAFAGRAAIVIQPSMPQWEGTGRADRVLAGFAFAPVGKRYRALRMAGRHAQVATVPTRPHVIVCFGGSDPFLITRRIAPVVASGTGWQTSVVVGPDFGGETDDILPDVLRDPPDLPERLAACDLAVIGAGTMKFEIACLGRPSLLLAAADDQVSGGPSYGASGAALWLGDGRTIQPEHVRHTVEGLLNDPARLASIGSRAHELVDGKGADRLADEIVALAT